MSQKEKVKNKVVRLTSNEERVIKFLRSSNMDMVSNTLTALEGMATSTNHLDFAVDLLSAYRGEVAVHTLESFIAEGKITRQTFDSLVFSVLRGENVIFLTDSGNSLDGRTLIQMVLNTVTFTRNQVVYVDKAERDSVLSTLIYSKDYLSSERDIAPYDNLSHYTDAPYRFTNVVEDTNMKSSIYKMYQQNVLGYQTIVNYTGIFRDELIYNFNIDKELNLPSWGTNYDLKYNIVSLNADGQYVTEKRVHQKASRNLV